MSARGTSAAVVAELQRIASDAGGILKAEDVVEVARNSGSVLHSKFCWDDHEAAQQYRLHQARELIRTTVTLLPVNGKEIPVRVFVSLTPNRQEEGGGYHDLISVMGNRHLKKQLIDDAIAELKTFEQKYAALTELADVFAASRNVRSWRTAAHERRAA